MSPHPNIRIELLGPAFHTTAPGVTREDGKFFPTSPLQAKLLEVLWTRKSSWMLPHKLGSLTGYNMTSIKQTLSVLRPLINELGWRIENHRDLGYRIINLKETKVRPIKVAVCSKLRHAEKFRKLNKPGIHFNSRWIYMGVEAKAMAKPASHWMEENFNDIEAADYVICYAEHVESTLSENIEGELLSMALVEVGYAMKCNKLILCIGNHISYLPWRAATHRVHFHPTLEDALNWIIKINSPAAAPIKDAYAPAGASTI